MSEPEFEPELTEEQVAALDAETADQPEPSGDQEEDEPAAPPEAPPEPSSALAMEEIGKSLDKLQKHVAKRISEILGDAATEWEECEVCNYWNTPGWRHKGPLPAEVEEVLRVALGENALADYKPDEYSRTCDRCNGLGEVLTGSKVQGQQALTCMFCKGMGWVPIGNERATGAFAMPNGQAAAPPPTLTPAAPPPADTPEIAAAKALLQAHGNMIIPLAPAVG